MAVHPDPDLPADPNLPYADAVAALAAASSVGLVCHVNPDPDALGSLLALQNALRQLERPVASSFPRPFKLSRGLAWMPGAGEILHPEVFPDAVDVLVTFDAADSERLHEFKHHADQTSTVIVVDHHRTNPGFGHVNLVDPRAASTGNVVAALLHHMEVKITPPIATCLYAALAADTGRFSFRADAATLAYAAWLVDCGADSTRVAEEIWGSAPLAALRLLGEVLVRAELDADVSLVSSYVTNMDLVSRGLDRSDTEDFVENLRMVSEVDVACLYRELPDGHVKVSLRGRGQVDLGALAARYGGGGHHDAAGFTAESFVTAQARVVGSLGSSAPSGPPGPDRDGHPFPDA
jgi:phosphoesterase RecJ-like protein